MIDQHPHSGTAVPHASFPLCAVLSLAGAIIAIGGYALPWYRTDGAAPVTVTGFGSSSSPAYSLHTNRLDWMIFLAAAAALVLAAARLAGRVDRRWARAHGWVSALALVGIAFTLIAVPAGLTLTTGAHLSAFGAAVLAAGGVVSRRELLHRS
ncbi:hypothetical protein [Gordonia shandongensis]|uniref:hypothetical protein n=1 Tax=Gordonia shandongensis TaxID=376351 RepID=UPI00042626EF|nr:hypothetical protein [Gordonia shandongensis]